MTWILFCPLYILIHNSFIGWAGQGIFLIFDIPLMPFLFFPPLDQVARIFLSVFEWEVKGGCYRWCLIACFYFLQVQDSLWVTLKSKVCAKTKLKTISSIDVSGILARVHSLWIKWFSQANERSKTTSISFSCHHQHCWYFYHQIFWWQKFMFMCRWLVRNVVDWECCAMCCL